MSEKRDQLIGARFTQKEREIIEKIAESRKNNLTEFIRESVFSHIFNLENNDGIIDVHFFMEKLKDMTNSIRTITGCIEKMRKGLNIKDIKKLIYDLEKEYEGKITNY